MTVPANVPLGGTVVRGVGPVMKLSVYRTVVVTNEVGKSELDVETSVVELLVELLDSEVEETASDVVELEVVATELEDELVADSDSDGEVLESEVILDVLLVADWEVVLDSNSDVEVVDSDELVGAPRVVDSDDAVEVVDSDVEVLGSNDDDDDDDDDVLESELD
ncbi:hypothetical protein CH063_16033 [Colletotrichum higginsianum]|uniref:Uncharacterized protein n=1 Tax=Colletotrichum higginsianum (strain IMI 349063) TaxID=759273 RepID=H1W5M3_COLHI|nr:hypothetical protein CH063_16033 [Colletotrichum higginsianum]